MKRFTYFEEPKTVTIYYKLNKDGQVHKAFLTGTFGEPSTKDIEDFIKTLNPRPSTAWV